MLNGSRNKSDLGKTARPRRQAHDDYVQSSGGETAETQSVPCYGGKSGIHKQYPTVSYLQLAEAILAGSRKSRHPITVQGRDLTFDEIQVMEF